jgi:hypothetical protein
MFRIVPIAVAVALLGACSSMDHPSSPNSTSAGGTSPGGGDTAQTRRGNGDVASQRPAHAVNTPPSEPGSTANAAPNSGCPNPGQGGDFKCQSPNDPSGFR